jgi:hypothetical protein
MTSPHPTDSSETTLTQDLLHAARYYLGGRRGFIILAAVAITAGLALNWSWLVAAGIAPILLGVLPCLAMCALGLCMHRAGGKSCSTSAGSPKVEKAPVTSDMPPAPRLTDDRFAEERAPDKAADHG